MSSGVVKDLFKSGASTMLAKLVADLHTGRSRLRINSAVADYLNHARDPRLDEGDGPGVSRKETPDALGALKSPFMRTALPSTSYLSESLARRLCYRSDICIRADDFVLQPIKNQLSQSGRSVTVVMGRCAPKDTFQHILIAYPEPRDFDSFAQLGGHSLSGGPSDYWPGSIGVMEFKVYQREMRVDYLQSSISFSELRQRGVLPKEYVRAYSGWARALVDQSLVSAVQWGLRFVLLPNSQMVTSLLQSGLRERAMELGFTVDDYEAYRSPSIILYK